MAVRYHRYGRNNVSVSRRWLVTLRAADAARIPFVVNSGHRTMREQRDLFKLNMHQVNGRWVPKPGRPLTAWPSCSAPHIRCDKANHALDVDDFRDGENKLQRWLNAHKLCKVKATNPVSGEGWHLEINALGLWLLYRRYRGKHG